MLKKKKEKKQSDEQVNGRLTGNGLPLDLNKGRRDKVFT